MVEVAMKFPGKSSKGSIPNGTWSPPNHKGQIGGGIQSISKGKRRKKNGLRMKITLLDAQSSERRGGAMLVPLPFLDGGQRSARPTLQCYPQEVRILDKVFPSLCFRCLLFKAILPATRRKAFLQNEPTILDEK
jgi:hypothetical protein